MRLETAGWWCGGGWRAGVQYSSGRRAAGQQEERRLGEERPAAQLLIIAGEPVRPVPAASPAAHTAQPPANQPHNHHSPAVDTLQHC